MKKNIHTRYTRILYPLFMFMITINLVSFTKIFESVLGLYILKYVTFFLFIGFLAIAYRKHLTDINLKNLIFLSMLGLTMLFSLFNVDPTSTGTSFILILNSLIVAFGVLFLFPRITTEIYVKLLWIMFLVVIVVVLFPSILISKDPSSYYLIGDRYRFLGYFNNTNELARFSALGFVLALRLLGFTQGFVKKSILLGIMILSIYIIVLTDSRAALLLSGIVFVMVLVVWLYRKLEMKLFIGATMAISIIMFIVVTPTALNQFGTWNLNEISSGRFIIWTSLIESRSTLDLLFGTGSGRTTLSATAILTNGYIEILMYFGIVGLVLWYMFIVYKLLIKFNKLRKHTVSQTGTIIIIGFMMYYLFEGGLISVGNIAGIYFWLELSQRKI